MPRRVARHPLLFGRGRRERPDRCVQLERGVDRERQTEPMSTRSGRSAAASVLAVAVIQVVAFAITTAIWVGSTIFAGGACAPRCDWSGADLAGVVYYLVAVVMFVCTAAAARFARRTEKDLTWVPLAASAGIVAGLLIALRLVQAAMGS